MKQFFINNYQWLILLISLISITIPFVIYFLQKKRFKPDIYVSAVWDRHFFNIEIINSGNEDIIDLKAKIFWQRDKKEECRELTSFINENQDPVFASPKNCKALSEKEKKIALGLPHYSDDGKVKVLVQGVGSKSKKSINKRFIVSNKIKGK